jgi:hypothetical protein
VDHVKPNAVPSDKGSLGAPVLYVARSAGPGELTLVNQLALRAVGRSPLPLREAANTPHACCRSCRCRYRPHHLAISIVVSAVPRRSSDSVQIRNRDGFT